MPLFRLTDVHLAYGPQILLDSVSLTLHAGERYGLLGRNGAGKSSFMKLLSGAIKPDGGEIWRRPGVKVAYLDQELPAKTEQSIYDFVAGGLEEVGALLSDYHRLSLQAANGANLDRLAAVQKQIEARDGWLLQQQVEATLSTLALPPETPLAELSGGWLRRVALARALVSDPDVLLLDEPTNHLDIPTIEWLEKQLLAYRGAVVLITHDRAFLQKIATQIMELDRGVLHCLKQDYRSFLATREAQLEAEEKANAEFDKKLAQEERWIRQGIKARRTRNEGRVRALQRMRDEYRQRRERQGNANLQLNQAEASGKIVAEAEHISHGYGARLLIRDFSTTIQRGDKVGFIGPNGVGKTTLLKILLGQIKPDQGRVKLGTKVELAYFDQMRASLDMGKSVRDNLAEGRDHVDVRGKPRHVMSYLQDFLFEPDRARQPVKALSGGEQNRLILAQLFSKPANVLVLDEPTNDLDLETLELLEDLLLDFDGTLLLVSHDRQFLDNVVTSSIVFEGRGRVKHYVGGYADWLRAGGRFDDEERPARAAEPAPASRKQAPQTSQAKGKLSYKLQRELEQLPGKIEEAEQRIADLEALISDPSFYDREHAEIDKTMKELSRVQEELDTLFERWESIEGQQ